MALAGEPPPPICRNTRCDQFDAWEAASLLTQMKYSVNDKGYYAPYPTTDTNHGTASATHSSTRCPASEIIQDIPRGACHPASVPPRDFCRSLSGLAIQVATNLRKPVHPLLDLQRIVSLAENTPTSDILALLAEDFFHTNPLRMNVALDMTDKLPDVGNSSCETEESKQRRISRNHARVVTGGRKITSTRTHCCCDCGKAFHNENALSKHKLKRHDEQRRFDCKICGKRFSQSCTLQTHVRVHTGEKPFACPHCPLHFSDSSTLVKHKRTHTGVRPYVCQVCSRAFSQSGNMRRHVKNVHTAPGKDP